MGIFSSIVGKIFPKSHAATAPSAPAEAVGVATAATVATAAAPAAAMAPVDVGAVLEEMLKNSGQTLNWKTSIVDLLKLLGLDSSLDARKKLAAELNYAGDTNDSATMNVWLHQEVMKKIAANGGKLPTDIKY